MNWRLFSELAYLNNKAKSYSYLFLCNAYFQISHQTITGNEDGMLSLWNVCKDVAFGVDNKETMHTRIELPLPKETISKPFRIFTFSQTTPSYLPKFRSKMKGKTSQIF